MMQSMNPALPPALPLALPRLFAALLLGAALLSACAAPPATKSELQFQRPIVLLGEVHDNAAQHALRLAAFRDWLAGGARPALLMEQFDRERQPDIDRLLAQQPPPSADELIAVGSPGPLDKSGWDWAFYRPFVALALQYELPIVAANVSRKDAREVMRNGLAAQGFDAAVPVDVSVPITATVLASHCGMLQEPMAARMALAQVARDQFMARVVQAHAERGVLLLAGNGHVRTDVGVPRWLTPAVRARSEAIGLLETGSGEDAAAYDRAVFTPAHQRPDPCEAMRRGMPR
jgi:uncharacterized iron-regulated protein